MVDLLAANVVFADQLRAAAVVRRAGSRSLHVEEHGNPHTAVKKSLEMSSNSNGMRVAGAAVTAATNSSRVARRWQKSRRRSMIFLVFEFLVADDASGTQPYWAVEPFQSRQKY
jgi:hypothetical protein